MPNVVYIGRVNARPRPTKPAQMNYSLITPVIVIVMLALAEELLALLTLLATSSLMMLVLATESSWYSSLRLSMV